MKTMSLLELNRRIGSDLMPEVYKQIPGFSLDLEELSLEEWLDIHQKAKDNNQQQEMANIIKEVFGVDIITSPIVGTFFSEGEWPCGTSKKELVRVGDHVKPSTIVCIIEAMKVPCHITAGSEGVITEILVEDGQEVNYDQVLFIVKPDL